MKFQFGSLGLLGTGAVLAGLLGLAVPAGAQQADWDTVVEAARKEGAVTIFSTQGLDQLNAFVKLVKDEYGIEVTVVRGTPADLQPKINADFATGQRFADVYVTSPGIHRRLPETLEGAVPEPAVFGAFGSMVLATGISQAGHRSGGACVKMSRMAGMRAVVVVS